MSLDHNDYSGCSMITSCIAVLLAVVSYSTDPARGVKNVINPDYFYDGAFAHVLCLSDTYIWPLVCFDTRGRNARYLSQPADFLTIDM